MVVRGAVTCVLVLAGSVTVAKLPDCVEPPSSAVRRAQIPSQGPAQRWMGASPGCLRQTKQGGELRGGAELWWSG